MNCTHDEGRGTLMTIGINPTQRNRQGHAFGHWPDKVDNNDRFFVNLFIYRLVKPTRLPALLRMATLQALQKSG
jgi:hypothetical protein